MFFFFNNEDLINVLKRKMVDETLPLRTRFTHCPANTHTHTHTHNIAVGAAMGGSTWT